MNHGLLVILSGFSGSGKGTLMKRLLEKYDNYALSVSATTRSPRPGEREGVDYFFKNEEEFSRMIKDDAFLEYARYVNHSYGTPAAYVDEQLDRGRDVILEIEIQGALKVKTKRPDTLLIFVTPPSAGELERRLTGRGTETREVIRQRMARAVEESGSMDQYDYILVNDDLEECVDQLHTLIQSQHSQTAHQREFIREIRQELKQSYAAKEREERK
ncbi:MAG: guanylate kinase [Eubacterium sp.]|nr:guanylate kinase [Eubacterium sp.]